MTDQQANNNEHAPQNENLDNVDDVIYKYVDEHHTNLNDSAIEETQLTVPPFAPFPPQLVPTIPIPFE